MHQNKQVRSLPIYLTVYASFFDIHAQLPILALFAASLGADPFWIGAIVGIYSIFNIVGNGIGGLAIDRWGWRRPLVTGLILVSLVLFGFQFIETKLALLLFRALNGFTGGVLIPATLAALSPDSGKDFRTEHNRNVAFFGISIGLAALTGPPFAGIISSVFNFKAAYLGIALLMSLAAVFTVFFTREAPKASGSDKVKRGGSFRLPAMSLTACLLSFALMGGTGTLAAFMPVLARQIGFSQGGIGMLFGLFALMVVALQSWRAVSGWTKFKPFNLALGGLTALLIALLILHYAGQQMLFAGAIIIYGIGFGVVFPTILVMVMLGIPKDKKGIITGIFFAFYSLGTAVVPPVAGFIWQKIPSVTPFLTAVCIMLLLTLAAAFSYRNAARMPE